MKSKIIISESNRPIWQIPIAALFFTLAFGLLAYTIYEVKFSNESVRSAIVDIKNIVFLAAIGAGFSSQKRIYIDLEHSKFKPTIEIGPLKFGKWKQIYNYEYVSVFHQPLQDGDYIYEVNLWYDRNKHFCLFEKNDYKEAFIIGYELSEELNIDLLDATVPNDYKWVDKNEWKSKMYNS
ncbi:hypothetical protein [Winogradskyella sp.]|jgi:hypothetical protein|uniref:hypothetical protein n=1 Tax=Winogradskyella sp. TaxID=1883156 RepID=UPI0025EE2868|nr:hypothetical protein [Winogradskyella sp.]MCT4629201.1 hypothetical protein [Winogradskyella sp.]